MMTDPAMNRCETLRERYGWLEDWHPRNEGQDQCWAALQLVRTEMATCQDRQ